MAAGNSRTGLHRPNQKEGAKQQEIASPADVSIQVRTGHFLLPYEVTSQARSPHQPPGVWLMHTRQDEATRDKVLQSGNSLKAHSKEEFLWEDSHVICSCHRHPQTGMCSQMVILKYFLKYPTIPKHTKMKPVMAVGDFDQPSHIKI